MRGILYKEFALSKVTLTVMCLYFSLFCVIIISMSTDDSRVPEAFYPIMNFLITYMGFFAANLLNAEIFRRDENRQWFGFAASTPQTLKKHLEGKYFFILIINLVLMFMNFLSAVIVFIITEGASDIMLSGFVCFCITMLLNAIEIPFIVRFGAEKGGGIKATSVGAVAFLLLVYGLFGDISIFFGDDPAAALMSLMDGTAMVWTLAILPYAAMILYYLSYKLSAKLYLKGAENYEQ